MKHIKYLFLIIFLPLLFLSGCQSNNSKQRMASEGFLDLTNWDFDKDGIATLDGTWEFYWKQLISPNEPYSSDLLTGYYDNPGYWTSYPELDLPSKGYATYRLRVKLDGKEHILSLSTPDIYTEYRLWINGELIESNPLSEAQEPTYLRPKIHEFSIDGSQLEIVLQVKNTRHIYAGLGQSILLGKSSMIYDRQTIHFAIDFFLCIICFLAGLYHFMLFILREKTLETLYFSMLCICVGLWTMFFNETLIMRLLPDLAFSIGSKIVTITIPLCVISMTLYTQALYRSDMSKFAVRFILAINTLYIVLIGLCKPYFYLQLFIPYLFSIVAVCLYGIYIAIRISLRKRPEYLYYIIGILLLAIGSFLNILEYVRVIDTIYFLPYSMVLFVFIQTLLLTKRYWNATRNVQILSSNLQDSIHKVEVTETAFLNAQIKPHFLYNTLNTIAQCCRSDPREAEELILYLSKYLRGTMNFENLGQTIPIKKELELVNAYVYIEKSRFQNINITFLVDESLNDCLIPPLLLQPLVENAIRHGIRNKEGSGFITLEIKKLENTMLFTIKDNGSGIEEELLSKLLTKPSNSKSIGLYNIHTRLMKLYGKELIIHSTIGVGTTIEFEIPI